MWIENHRKEQTETLNALNHEKSALIWNITQILGFPERKIKHEIKPELRYGVVQLGTRAQHRGTPEPSRSFLHSRYLSISLSPRVFKLRALPQRRCPQSKRHELPQNTTHPCKMQAMSTLSSPSLLRVLTPLCNSFSFSLVKKVFGFFLSDFFFLRVFFSFGSADSSGPWVFSEWALLFSWWRWRGFYGFSFGSGIFLVKPKDLLFYIKIHNLFRENLFFHLKIFLISFWLNHKFNH